MFLTYILYMYIKKCKFLDGLHRWYMCLLFHPFPINNNVIIHSCPSLTQFVWAQLNTLSVLLIQRDICTYINIYEKYICSCSVSTVFIIYEIIFPEREGRICGVRSRFWALHAQFRLISCCLSEYLYRPLCSIARSSTRGSRYAGAEIHALPMNFVSDCAVTVL